MKLLLISAATLLYAAATLAEAPHIDPADDAEHFGMPQEELFWTPEQQVAGYRNMDKITWTRAVPAGNNPYPLPADLRGLSGVVIASDDETMTLDDYVRTQNVAGLIVVKDGEVLYERYELGNTEESRWISYSVAKSVTSLLVGAAISDGYIRSVDEAVSDYLPRLKNSSYDDSTIRDVLQMSSGVAWTEDYADRDSDINQVTWATLPMYEYLSRRPREHEPGTVFNYNTAETNLIGNLLRSAVGNNLSTYLSEKIWKPFGMEHDAYWALTGDGGGEFGGSSLNATLRDYARLGLFALRGGRLQNTGTYSAADIFGQGIYINPATGLVIALNSAWDVAVSDRHVALKLAMYSAIDEAVSRQGNDHE